MNDLIPPLFLERLVELDNNIRIYFTSDDANEISKAERALLLLPCQMAESLDAGKISKEITNIQNNCNNYSESSRKFFANFDEFLRLENSFMKKLGIPEPAREKIIRVIDELRNSLESVLTTPFLPRANSNDFQNLIIRFQERICSTFDFATATSTAPAVQKMGRRGIWAGAKLVFGATVVMADTWGTHHGLPADWADISTSVGVQIMKSSAD